MNFSEKLYKIGEASSLLGVHPNTIRRWEREGKIKIVRIGGGHRRIPASEITRLMRKEAQISPVSSETDYEKGLRAFLDFVFTHCKNDHELVKRAIFVRDGYRCRICGSSEDLALKEKDPGLGIIEGNLMTICRKCSEFKEVSEKKEILEEKIEEQEKITRKKILNDLSPSGIAQRVAFGEILSAALVLNKFSLKELVVQSKSPEPVVRTFCERMEALGYLQKTESGYEIKIKVVE